MILLDWQQAAKNKKPSVAIKVFTKSAQWKTVKQKWEKTGNDLKRRMFVVNEIKVDEIKVANDFLEGQ